MLTQKSLSVDSKYFTEKITYLESTLAKNRGWGWLLSGVRTGHSVKSIPHTFTSTNRQFAKAMRLRHSLLQAKIGDTTKALEQFFRSSIGFHSRGTAERPSCFSLREYI